MLAKIKRPILFVSTPIQILGSRESAQQVYEHLKRVTHCDGTNSAARDNMTGVPRIAVVQIGFAAVPTDRLLAFRVSSSIPAQ